MTIIEQLNLVKEALADWAKDWGATADVAADRADVFARMAESTNRAQCLVYLESEEAVSDESDDSGMFWHTILIVISRGRPLTINKADNLVAAKSHRDPFYDVIEAGRTILRNLNFTPTQQAYAADRDQILPNYRGFRVWRGNEDLPLDAREFEIRILTQIIDTPEATA